MKLITVSYRNYSNASFPRSHETSSDSSFLISVNKQAPVSKLAS